MRIIILVAFLCIGSMATLAQVQSPADTLVGLVVNVKGKGIKNIPVFTSNKEEPVRTDRKGIFVIVQDQLPDSISVMLPSKRIFQIPVNGMNFLKIKTGEEEFFISEGEEEIVTIGYGTQRKRNTTSGSFSVTGQELLDTGETDLIRAIAGKIPGLNLNYTDDGSVTLEIRGGTSLDGRNEPLYIIDGAISDDFRYLNLYDIEKVDVLKDGSIYGARGANGAIVVTTQQ
ncbi:TonB-dependent receptor plug domain-containing protein [Draconibacterium sediminis]|uniref:TonB-dependent receptor plug domain-containing protein n=1 Tax=Draconibacterium sediminis TaxID=1544798 RepID=A0A0D8JAL4_9BACT|nr:TonB-dependent receptor plug domain-containing protein [Draconibacterium sediminis]KJF43571.1 hypothetical protein LH29_10630 [Draconibacterium sediminis]